MRNTMPGRLRGRCTRWIAWSIAAAMLVPGRTGLFGEGVVRGRSLFVAAVLPIASVVAALRTPPRVLGVRLLISGLAVAGLVSIHDAAWTTESGCGRG